MRACAFLLLLGGCATSEYERMSRLEREVRHAAARHAPEARLMLWLARADGREILAIRADERVAAASTIKVLILVEAHAQALEGTLRFSDSVTFLEEDRVGGAGSLQDEKAGSTWTYNQLARRMIGESDNVASNLLLRRVGMANANRRAMDLGLVVTRFGRHFMDEDARREGKENWTTAREMGELLRLILRKKALPAAACDEMIQALERTPRVRIARGVPRDVPVGHKNGTAAGMRHDAGWVRISGQPYVLSIFLDNVLERPAGGVDGGTAAIEAISTAVWQALGPGDE
jgi:beta-lactamase class A